MYEDQRQKNAEPKREIMQRWLGDKSPAPAPATPSPDARTVELLSEQNDILQSIRKMLKFFVVLACLGMILAR